MFKTVYILFMALLISSCGLFKEHTKEVERTTIVRDSVSYTHKQVVDTLFIPADSSRVRISLDSLIKIGKVSHTSGRATTSIKYINNQLEAECYCDSLMQAFVSTTIQETLKQYFNQTETTITEKKEKKVGTSPWAIVAILTIIVLLLIGVLWLKSKK